MKIKIHKNHKKHSYVFLTKTTTNAQTILGLTFEIYGYETLNDSLYEWLHNLTKDAKADILFDNIEEILKKYTINELLSPSCVIEGIGTKRYTRFIALFIFLILLVQYSWDVYGKAIEQKKENAWDINTTSENYSTLSEYISNTDILLVQHTLKEALLCTIDKDYYHLFFNSLNAPNATPEENLSKMENDPELSLYKKDMVLFVALRCFIDSSFFLFGSQ